MNRRPVLTARETEILAHVARGLATFQIADVEHVSPETVKSHLHNVFRKLRARNRAHAVAIAYHVGIFATGAATAPPTQPPRSVHEQPARKSNDGC